MVEGNKNLIIADSKNASVGMIIDAETIKEKIYNIRNQKVMLDFELAEIYGYETKNFNRQIKNNIEKFEGEDFMFRLTADEFKNLRCKNFTSSWGGSRYLPYAFTEQGIYMLMTVLRGDLAVKQSRALVRTFKQMKDFIVENRDFIVENRDFIVENRDFIGANELAQLAIQTNQNTKDIAEIKSQMATKEDFNKVMDNFINPDSYKHFLLMDGNKIEADLAYCKIYESAKKSIYVVDNYIGLKTLELLRFAGEGVGIVVFSDNSRNKNMLTESMLGDFVSDYPGVDLKFKTAGRKYHDRYVVIDYGTADEAVYVCARRPTFALKA
ncbi:ORF6N domain-containing protein [Gardnerella leopoldii]|uniref:ORF6N domain-containing protein n=1 Tax=Gardnerella leopoldii TaxID=2792978 RepID=UPI001571B29B|nr:ORF6N domain-containing protein [Gardnerella vaginalis]NSX45262.1 ORF6N domain-containing protein [Gardnerella vaginalis]